MEKRYKIKWLLVLIAAFAQVISFAQVKKFSYNVIQDGDKIGSLVLEKKDSSNTIFLNMESSVYKKFILSISIYEKQRAIIENGEIIYSSIYRKVNSKIKTNRALVKKTSGYQTIDKNKAQPLGILSIKRNQLHLYFEEPINYTEVYSDQFMCFLQIKKIKDGEYKINLPDGNTNYYYYKNNTCCRIKLDHTFFTAEFIIN